MNILIAYDGSASADSALDDLQRAGLPYDNVNAIVLSVAEVWLPPPNPNGFNEDEYPNIVKNWTRERMKIVTNAVSEAETFSRHARDRVKTKFPKWTVSSETASGSPGWEILARATELKCELIVVGAQGRNPVSRILLGSISQKVLAEAHCSVRVSRGKIEVDPAPARILIGFDGSLGSHLAVKHVASRSWTKDSEVTLLAATHSLVPSEIGRFVSPAKNGVINDESQSKDHWLETVAATSVRMLEKAGLTVEFNTNEGNPKKVLVDYAKRWRADSIFIGAHSYTILERYLIGSTSSAIAERAHCSVEVVREMAN